MGYRIIHAVAYVFSIAGLIVIFYLAGALARVSVELAVYKDMDRAVADMYELGVDEWTALNCEIPNKP